MSSGTPDLTPVREAASHAEGGRRHLVTEIRRARGKGASLRAIAEAAGLSHETVRRIAGQPAGLFIGMTEPRPAAGQSDDPTHASRADKGTTTKEAAAR